jgi:hypothetical protein
MYTTMITLSYLVCLLLRLSTSFAIQGEFGLKKAGIFCFLKLPSLRAALFLRLRQAGHPVVQAST